MAGKRGQRKFCERLNLPACAGLGMKVKKGNTEGGIRQGR